MRLTPYLSFNGQCEAALKFYEMCLGGKVVTMMTYAQSPMGGADGSPHVVRRAPLFSANNVGL